ncbi:DUF317 domain-containing protein [Streptomyces sp. S1A]|uniref:DUF317 domain-containing protein n=1 Tax=Streptomyces sp. ICN903 TaxID=2964654 RepID=UPI001EDA67E4|nr:DUF317 domain-containing protein [Streptomyces sp. ICN903]MCG3039012.1 DUF317 domain-containing protein [Streptomyces sp. ICN903]
MNTPSPLTDDDRRREYHVAPRYLAGPTHTGDPALRPLLEQGWDIDDDELGNVYVTAPDHTARLGYLPEGEDDVLWKIAAYSNPFGPPHWVTTFNDATPTEIVTGFTTALAEKYAQGRDGYLHGNHRVQDGYAPLAAAGWTVRSSYDHVEVTAPDEQAGLVYRRGRTDHLAELFGHREKWTLWGGPEGYGSRWYGTHSTHTPASLIAAATSAMADPAPVVRSRAEVPRPVLGAGRGNTARTTGVIRPHATGRPPSPSRPGPLHTTHSPAIDSALHELHLAAGAAFRSSAEPSPLNCPPSQRRRRERQHHPQRRKHASGQPSRSRSSTIREGTERRQGPGTHTERLPRRERRSFFGLSWGSQRSGAGSGTASSLRGSGRGAHVRGPGRRRANCETVIIAGEGSRAR